VTGLTMQETLDKVQTLPERSVIMYGVLLRDAAGVSFTGPDGLTLVSRASRVPIYSTRDSLLGHGIVGGPLASFESHGVTAGELGLRVLRGERLGSADIVVGTNPYVFDARQLSRFGIDERRLPAGSTVQFRSEPPWLNYLDVGRKAAGAGEPHAAAMLDAIESVLQERTSRALIEYSWCDGDRWFEMAVEPFQRPEGGAIVLHVDVTRRRLAEDEARRQRDELAHVLRSATMGELAGALAHEINQPLAAILTNAQTARQIADSSGHGPDDLQATLADIGNDAKRAADIIARLRALFRKETATRVPVDVDELVTDVAGLLRHDLQRRGILIAFALQPSLPPVSGDPVQLQQVVLNLVVNASDAMATGDGTRREIRIATRRPDSYSVELSVSDSGVGVPESDLERIFAPFVSTKREGLGLGLSISRSIVAAHGGRIWATRNPERGITVHVQLPCGVVNANREPGDFAVGQRLRK
jgi:signal transduction histidine kinase